MKIARTDQFIEIGSQHKMCEDYIISGQGKYIILSDGCSASDNSEMGARFLCYFAKDYLKKHAPYFADYKEKLIYGLGMSTISDAWFIARTLGLKKTCLDATLIVAYVAKEYLHIHMFGDGFIIVNNPDKSISTYQVEYKSQNGKSMPYYLRYDLDPEGLKSYHEQKVTKTIITQTLFPNGAQSSAKVEEVAYDQAFSSMMHLETFEAASICSDGLASFIKPVADPNGNKIQSTGIIARNIFNFQHTAGVFLQRRMNVVNRLCKKDGTFTDHFDDLSIGTFLVEDYKFDFDDTNFD